MSSGSSNAGGHLRLSIGLLSAAITGHQLVLMQVLGYVHWHHFAYMVVAVALLGFGAAGTVLTFWREPLLARASWILPWAALACGAAMPWGVRLSQAPALAFDLHVLFVEPRQWLALASIYACLVPAFFFGGLATSLILTARAAQAGRYYFPSLAGAGAGGIVGVLVLQSVAPTQAPAAVAVLAVAASSCLWPGLAQAKRVALAVGAVLVLVASLPPLALRPSQFKAITFALDLPDARLVAQEPSARGWVQIVAAPALRPSPPLSLNFPGALPTQRAVFINGYAYGGLLDAAAVENPAWMDFTPEAVGYVGRSRSRVLLLETGPGGAAAHARAQGARQIVVIESHRALVRLLNSASNENVRAPEWTLPEVEVRAEDGRQFLRRSRQSFDLIVFPPAGAPGGAGVTSTTEQFLLTREALRAAWDRLAADGALVLSAPLEFPVRHPLRLLATIVEALEHAGVSTPGAHVVAVRSWSNVTFLVGRTAFSDTFAAAVREFCEARSFDPLVLPDLQPGERTRYNDWPDPGFFRAVDRLLGPAREQVYRDYAFRIRPATDDRPWFGQFLRWNTLRDLRTAFGSGRLPFFELGTVLVALTFVQLLVLAIVCILLPLRRLRMDPRPTARATADGSRWGTVVYFSGLGAGFMLVEIGLMIRVHGWLGSPLLAAGVVLSGLLVFAGLGSGWSERRTVGSRTRMIVVGAAALVIVFTGWATAALLEVTGSWPLGVQAAIALLLMAPLGLVLGHAFPLGLRELQRHAPAQVPWAWGINGCVSVATPAGAMLLGLEAGIGAIFAAGAFAYVLALVAAWRVGIGRVGQV